MSSQTIAQNDAASPGASQGVKRAAAGAAGGFPAAGPPSGSAYIASLRDARVVFIDGQRVWDVTSHPALRNAVRSIARLYDALHDPAQQEILTSPADTLAAGPTHRFFRVARSREELIQARRAIEHWARLTFGWMGRTPDYKAALTATFGAAESFYGPHAANARRWYALAQDRLPYISHALANPPVDRHLPPHQIKDVCIHAHQESDAGIVVSGAKVVATGAAITNWCFVGQTPGTVSDDPSMALAFMVPIDAPGVRLICRNSYEQAASLRTPFDAPLSSRFDENDAILVLENVQIPWENVLIYRDAQRVKRFFTASGFLNNFLFHGCTRLAVKLDFLAGLLAKALHATGGMEARGKRALLGEVLAWSHAFHGLADAMASAPDPWPGDIAGAVMPSRRAALAYCVLAPDCYPRIKDIIERTVGSGLIYLPSSAADLQSPEIDPLLRKYVRGSAGAGRDGPASGREAVDHRQRIKILKLLWDAVGSEFGGRHELYERNYAGGWECIRLMVAGEAEQAGRLGAMEDLVDRCMADYDEQGWTGATWLGPRSKG